MWCKTPEILLGTPYAVMEQCHSCPLFTEDPECYRSIKVLRNPVTYVNDDGTETTVLPGFCTDGMSAPKFLQPVTGGSWETPYLRPALRHDADYASHDCPKHEADLHLLYLLAADGVEPMDRESKYKAVSLFGGGAYDKGDAVVAHFKQFVCTKGTPHK